MKLINLLLENEEDGMKQIKINTDLAIQPTDIKAALKALEKIDNYGPYAQNLRDKNTIIKVFGPSIPAQKTNAALKDWDSRSEDEKAFKLIDIKKRAPEDFKKAMEAAKDGFDKWYTEGNDGDIEDYLYTLTGKELPKDLVGRYGKNYFPMKTPANLKKYSGKLEPGVHYFEKGDKIVFPQANSPYNPKAYLQKVLTTIMDNAKLDYKIVDVEVGDDLGRTAEKPKKEEVPPLTATLNDLKQVEKLRKSYQKEIGEVPSAEYKTEKVDGKYKLIVTGLTKQQRQKLFTTKALFTQNLKEENDFSRIMKLRAGIIK